MSSRTYESLVTHWSIFHCEDCPIIVFLDPTTYVSITAPTNLEIFFRAWYYPFENLLNHWSRAEIISINICVCTNAHLLIHACVGVHNFQVFKGVHYTKRLRNPAGILPHTSLCVLIPKMHSNNVEVQMLDLWVTCQ